MGKRRRFSRLGGKLAGISVLGLALAFAVFYLVDNVAVPWLLFSDRFNSFWESRSTAAITAYQDYVTAHDLTVLEALEYVERSSQTPFSGVVSLYVASYDSNFFTKYDLSEGVQQEFTISNTSGTVSSIYTQTSSIIELHQLQCADGLLLISTPSSAVQIQSFGRLAGFLLALLVFCAVMIPCIVWLVRRVGELSRETGVLMAGELDHAVHIKGRDEISGLGENIERLRRSVLVRIEGEREAVGANGRLITTLSHDLRTPLTKLTGYLDILSYGKYRSQTEHDEFLRLASEKAAQIKALTDQLFASAQVTVPEPGLERPPEAVDGAALLGQLLTEQCDDLRREGFDVQPPLFRQDFTLYLRTEDAVRVFDNLFSNLRKYADPTHPVTIRAEDGPEAATVEVTNRLLPAPDRADSHGLGVPTMQELMARSGGTLAVSAKDGVYRSVLAFPKYRRGGSAE